ncbi:hypothetical protein A71_247 [Escherichia phage A7_1]|uniref:Uncharacterized protein n=2 Tax=Vequintavirinae TaxID=1911928 RepID=A0AAE9W0L8_9CAUD|nr:hypothetical protein A71_247 [Escherichia phage A7_1]UZZ64330.1 hypothetical protein A54_90 [Escherichia phage A5-4]WBF77675.1 hypothetical protein A73_15 [Escherichia phage A73]
MNIVNITGKTEILKNLAPGESTVWICKDGEVEKQMRLFTAICCRLNMKVTQIRSMIVSVGNIPTECIILTKI